MKKSFLSFVCVLCCLSIFAQTSKEYVTVYAEPDHEDWTYSVKENAKVKIYAVCQNVILKDVEFTYSYGPDKLSATYNGTVRTDKDGFATIKVPGAKAPGFITVNSSLDYQGQTWKGRVNLAFDPDKIRPTVPLPDDFEQYWEQSKAKSAQVPMTVSIRRNDEQSTDDIDVYYVKVQAYRVGTHFYGVLSVPKGEGRKPAILRLPGAAVRSFSGPSDLASQGFIVLEMGVHGIPVDQDPDLYAALSHDGLSDYVTRGIEDRDTYYYKRVYMSCVRAIDYLCSREDVDPERIAVYGGSQGGMLSIVTAALDKRVSAIFAYFPAFSDVTGYYNVRGGGWPHLFLNRNEKNIEAKIRTVSYYDTANFARYVTIPGIYAFGYNDITCCPTSTYSAYNVIPGPKELMIARDTGHWLYPWQTAKALDWLKERFGME